MIGMIVMTTLVIRCRKTDALTVFEDHQSWHLDGSVWQGGVSMVDGSTRMLLEEISLAERLVYEARRLGPLRIYKSVNIREGQDE